MNIDANDPRWTAYAFGEITDPSERAEMDRILEESPEVQRLVSEIRETGLLLADELHAEPAPGLTDAQRRRIDARTGRERNWFGLRLAWAMPTFAIIGILLASLVAVQIFRRPESVESPIAALGARRSPPIPEQASTTSDSAESIVSSASRPPASAPAVQGTPASAREAAPPPHPNPPAAVSENPPSAEAVLKEEKLSEQPLVNKSVLDLIKVAGGVATTEIPKSSSNSFAGIAAAQKNAQRDGTAVNDVRWGTGLLSALAPVDAEMGRGSGMARLINPHGRPPVQGEPTPGQSKRGRFNTEAYDRIVDNPFLDAVQNPLSTFSIDVDTASYSNVRRFLAEGRLPPKDAVRIEELINYFDYDDKGPVDDKPFAVNFELTEAPWKPEHRLLRVGIKAREIKTGMRPGSNLVFLIDVSGSMAAENKLPLVKQSLRLLVDQLTESDRIAIVVYAGDSGLALPSTSGDQKEMIRQAIDCLRAGGSTNGASGIELAYRTVQENFSKGGVNRVILATDGDFNVGTTSRGELTRLIEEKSSTGVFLSALGFGMGNYKDSTLQTLADKGRGNYGYIDTLNEAKKLLVEQINATLVPIAKDVKIQVEFNPRRVSAYRLIGYENRIMAKEDFNDDQKQAGVIGAGRTVTALYEIVPAGVAAPKGSVDPLKYQKPVQPSAYAGSNELVTVKIRSKKPDEDKSVLSEFVVKDSVAKFAQASQDFKFTAAVAAFGMVLRGSPYKGTADLEHALSWAKEGKGADRSGYREEFIRLIHRAISF